MLAFSWTDWMPNWMLYKFMNIELWRWLTVLGVLLVSMIIGKILSFILNHHGKKCLQRGKLHLAGLLFQSIAKPCSLLILAGGIYVSGLLLKLPDNIRPLYFNICDTVIAIAIIWAAFKLVNIIEFGLSRLTAKTETTLDDQLVPLVRKTLRVFVVIVGGLFIAQTIFDWNIGAMLAGLGIGGLAFALAAKDMLSNFFGSATIFADRPFTMGDRIKVRSYDGMVEEVGFRSTRIRLLNGHLVSLPNG
ncbi:MAG: mechanosensitive ion channel family protein, partial [Phycisphaerae bacterium]|nr:mechanosensitive ion channel family protein [Phycisphaerae bacterium]